MKGAYVMYHNNAIDYSKCSLDFSAKTIMLAGMKWNENLRRLMAERKMIQQDLVPILGVKTRGAVGHYLSGIREPSLKQLNALAGKFDVTLDELVNDKSTDTVQTKINQIIRAADKAMSESDRKFTDEERMKIYKVAFVAGLEEEITVDQIVRHLRSFVQ